MGEDVQDVNHRRAARMRGAERYKVKDVEFSIDPNLLIDMNSSPSNSEHRSPSSTTSSDGRNKDAFNGVAAGDNQAVNGEDEPQQAQVQNHHDVVSLLSENPEIRPEPRSSSKRGRPRKDHTPNNSARKSDVASAKRHPSAKKGSVKKRSKQEVVRKLYEPFIQPYRPNDKSLNNQLENEKSPLLRQQSEINYGSEHADSSIRAFVSSEAPQERIPSPISSSAHNFPNKYVRRETSPDIVSPINPTTKTTPAEEIPPSQGMDELVNIELTKLSKDANGKKQLNKFDVIQQLFQELIAEIEPGDPYLLKVKNAFAEHVSVRLLEFIDLLDVNQALYSASRKAAKEKFFLQQELSNVRQTRLALQNKKSSLRISYRETSDASQKLENLDEFLIECESLKRLLDINDSDSSQDTEVFSLNEFSSALCGEKGIYEQLQDFKQLLDSVFSNSN
ncbi:kinetochore protein Mis17 [Schizosaccharomyces octosporus yFS286]|uniref:Kinetochore protein Mis17 n=1 Tax=Schizosaccharomyces octosporus (strain yFS286) TaxID=483514 RepID=S9PTA9_SCHOY|nr:kinetochore protein Mis17 [Schizosaccharomyces octosporus yFS286]EPX72386.1 kinetochore protein Mis17 [Schizosaccharomyces octosporus yFS286]